MQLIDGGNGTGGEADGETAAEGGTTAVADAPMSAGAADADAAMSMQPADAEADEVCAQLDRIEAAVTKTEAMANAIYDAVVRLLDIAPKAAKPKKGKKAAKGRPKAKGAKAKK